MRIAIIRRSTLGLIVVLFMALTGCVGVGGYGVGFYEPVGYDYGGWHSGYRVGPPPRGGYDHPARSDEHQARTDTHPSQPTYRPASPSRSIPSIPTQSHGGQSHGGQSHGGQSSGGGRSGQ